MPEGPLGGPRPLAGEKEVFLSFRLERKFDMQPRELEIQQAYTDIRGPTVEDIDVQIKTLEDDDIIVSDELDKGIEISSQQMIVVAEHIEDELAVNVKSDFIQVI